MIYSWIEFPKQREVEDVAQSIIDSLGLVGDPIVLSFFVIAQCIDTFAKIADTDCGFSTFAGFGAVDKDIVYAKLASMAEGAEIASKRLWS